jgi:hypothetical protein
MTVSGPLQVYGTLLVPVSVTLTAATLTLEVNGELQGPGAVSVSGAAALDNGSALGVYATSGSGPHLLLRGASTVSGTVYLRGTSKVENQGTLTLSDSSDLYDQDALRNTLQNDSGATITYTGSNPSQIAYISW